MAAPAAAGRSPQRCSHTQAVPRQAGVAQPGSGAYTYEMLLEDCRLGYIVWWMSLITLGAGTLPIFDQPEGERIKRLWGQGIP